MAVQDTNESENKSENFTLCFITEPSGSVVRSGAERRRQQRNKTAAAASTDASRPPSLPQRKIVTIPAASTTVQELYRLATTSLQLSTNDGSCSVHLKVRSSGSGGAQQTTITLDPLSLETLQQLSERNILHNQDRITVVVEDSEATADKPKATTTRKPTGSTAATKRTNKASSSSNSMRNESSSPPPPPPQNGSNRKRKAAVEAMASIAAAIQNDEAMMSSSSNANQSKAKSTPPKRPPPKAAGTSTPNGRYFAALNRSSAQSTAAHDSVGGRRLHDGATVTSTASRRRPQQRQQQRDNENNNTASTSLVEGLIQATTDTTAAARFMRQGWRQAVNSAYEQNQAVCRLAAAVASLDHISFTLLTNANTSDASSSSAVIDPTTSQPQLQVSYAKGVQGRGNYTDVVDYLDLDVLQATIRAVYPTEALRGSNLALLSPRVFWSLIYHFHQRPQDDDAATTTSRMDVVTQALQWTCSDLDWSFLRRRPVQLSAKARENLRQQQQKDGDDDDDANWDAAANAIVAVEQAMADLPSMASRNSNIGHAEESTDSLHEEDWHIVTPDEEDTDELLECILSFDTSTPEGELKNDSTSYHRLSMVVQMLCHDLQVRNWRQLANVDNVVSLSEKLDERFRSRRDGVDSRNPDVEDGRLVSISVEAIEAWVEYAQRQSMEEIIVEICDGQTEAVELLHESARCGTPKDLAAWQSNVVHVLREQMVDFVATSASDISRMTPPDVKTLQLWTQRARRAIKQLEWLDWYATPIG